MSPPPESGPLAPHDLVGRFATLEIRRFGSPGAFLVPPDAGPEAETILLLGPEIPPGAQEGDQVSVFVALDSAGRPLATTAEPHLALGQVTFLTVTARTEFGAFVDWGLPKELLVPFAEQTRDVQVGERHPIGLYLDNTGRLAGTMRVNQMLTTDGEFHQGEWVEGEAWRNEPDIGLFVIIERRFLGLVPAEEPHTFARAQAARFRVARVLADGKIVLSARGPVQQELERDAATILNVLARPGAAPISDKAAPEEIRARFGLSKKAFKRAVGTLLKAGRVDVDGAGRVRLVTGPRG